MQVKGSHIALLFVLLGAILSAEALTRVRTHKDGLDKHKKGHQCIHDQVQTKPPVEIAIRTKSGITNKRNPSNPESIRILFDVTALDDENVCTEDGQVWYYYLKINQKVCKYLRVSIHVHGRRYLDDRETRIFNKYHDPIH